MELNNVTAGDVVQIVDETDPWFATLLIVDEVKTWGVIAYTITPQDNTGDNAPIIAYKRLPFSKIARVGEANIKIETAND